MKTATPLWYLRLRHSLLLSVPYTLGWRLQQEDRRDRGLRRRAYSSLYFGMKTATLSAGILGTFTHISFSSLYFGMKTATQKCPSFSPRPSSSFSSLYFGMKTATRIPFPSKENYLSTLSVPYTLGWRLQPIRDLSTNSLALLLSVPYTLGWRLQPGTWQVPSGVEVISFSSLYFGMKTATLVYRMCG